MLWAQAINALTDAHQQVLDYIERVQSAGHAGLPGLDAIACTVKLTEPKAADLISDLEELGMLHRHEWTASGPCWSIPRMPTRLFEVA